MGAKLLGGLPEGNSLTPEFIAEDFLGNKRDLICVVVLRAKYTKIDDESDEAETTQVLRIAALEHVDNAADVDSAQKLLRKLHADRTGEHVLPGLEAVTDDRGGSSTGDSGEYVRQVQLLRAERVAELREKAEDAADKDQADLLEAEADSFEAGHRDEELRAQLSATFSHPA